MISTSKIFSKINYVFPPTKANDRQLLDDHRIVHAWWKYIQKYKKNLTDRKTGKKIDKKEIIDRHTQIVEEMFSRGFKHYYRSSLDDTLPKKLKEKTVHK